MSAIELEHVSKRFPGATRPAVDDCSLTVSGGELAVLLGPSGCGKTTLLKLINRLYEPDSGRILIGGTDARLQPATTLRRGIGYVIQQVGLFPHRRVAQNIATVPELMNWPRERVAARVVELLDLVGLPREYGRRYPRQLSGGEQQRVGLARALAADPAILLMDEPFGALDAITRTRLQDELRVLHKKLGKTIVFVTHDVDEALRLADRIAVMKGGRIVQHGTSLEIITHPHDDFVRRLLTSDDVLRQLSLVPVSAVVAGAPPAEAPAPGGLPPARAGSLPAVAASTVPADEGPAVRATDDLRTALSVLLQSGNASLRVIGNGGRSVGRIAFEDIRRAVIASRGAVPRTAADQH